MLCKKYSLFSFLRPSLWAEQTPLDNFGRGSHHEQLCEIIFHFGLQSRKSCRLKVILFLALMAILFSGAEPFGQLW